jgi:ribosome-binding factor A
MPSHRSLRIAEAIREVVASSILFDVADPRVHSVTVLRVEVSGDLHNATVFVSIMGNESEQETALRGLKHAAGYLQAKVAARLQTRSTPVLVFKRDDSVKRSIEMARLIDDALAADRDKPGPPEDDSETRGEEPLGSPDAEAGDIPPDHGDEKALPDHR